MKLLGKTLVISEPPAVAPQPEPAPAASSSIVDGLFRRHARRVAQFMALRLRGREDGEEATQELFLKLWSQEAEGRLRDEATAYMYSAARNTVVDLERHRRSRGHGLHEEDDLEAVADVVPDPEDALHWRRAMLRLTESLRPLPQPIKQAFLLHYFSDMTYDEVAAQLGISRRTAERHVARAFAHCRVRMRDYL